MANPPPDLRPDQRQALRALPPLDGLLALDAFADSCSLHGRGVVAHHLRRVLDQVRDLIRGAGPGAHVLGYADLDAVVARAKTAVDRDVWALPRTRNGTGVILPSGLGRAPLPRAAVAAMSRAGGYSLLEVDRDAGDRKSRDTRAGELLHALTGAEASLVVNNNAAATLLILSTLGAGREVICSRGEMVEIGGSYRIPDICEASGCELVAVGCTNKTHTRDYERAIRPETGALLVVHTSNYRIVGFTETPELSELAQLAKSRGIPLVHDLGSGSLLSPEQLGFGDEPPVMASLKAGADVVCMSGDKLLGGPQAGIILGRKDLVDRMRKHPLARALRVDKSTLAALEATLALFLNPERLRAEHPVIGMLTADPKMLAAKAESLRTHCLLGAPTGTDVEVIAMESETGSGALPTLKIPSFGVAIRHPLVRATHLSKDLRFASPGVFTRLIDGRVCLDVRTLFAGEELEAADVIARTLRKAVS
ncbi:MAG TPA: L-seryl-tRNA(Sec) selenium transferase [Planctomycetota bacterium]|nr:L-seryl-tRNA(Sec) selenium transferase [Planctomycetota bacterium]